MNRRTFLKSTAASAAVAVTGVGEVSATWRDSPHYPYDRSDPLAPSSEAARWAYNCLGRVDSIYTHVYRDHVIQIHWGEIGAAWTVRHNGQDYGQWFNVLKSDRTPKAVSMLNDAILKSAQISIDRLLS